MTKIDLSLNLSNELNIISNIIKNEPQNSQNSNSQNNTSQNDSKYKIEKIDSIDQILNDSNLNLNSQSNNNNEKPNSSDNILLNDKENDSITNFDIDTSISR